jgi:HSP20 family molecular chaperone IbpA
MAQQDLVRERGNVPENVESTRAAREVTPPVDIFENAEELLLVADLPGVEPDSLSIQLDPPELRIEGRSSITKEGERTLYYVRRFQVGETIDPNGISAELRNGILNVHLKKGGAHRPRRIEVRAG